MKKKNLLQEVYIISLIARMGKTTLLKHIAERQLTIPPNIDVLLCEQGACILSITAHSSLPPHYLHPHILHYLPTTYTPTFLLLLFYFFSSTFPLPTPHPHSSTSSVLSSTSPYLHLLSLLYLPTLLHLPHLPSHSLIYLSHLHLSSHSPLHLPTPSSIPSTFPPPPHNLLHFLYLSSTSSHTLLHPLYLSSTSPHPSPSPLPFLHLLPTPPLLVSEVEASDRSAIDVVLSADKKRLALLEEEKALLASADANTDRLQQVGVALGLG